MKLTFLYIVFFVLIGQHTSAADFRYLRTNEGLYNGEINSIAQDQSGKMWFATWTGLASYNGFDYEFFKPELGNPLSLSDKKTNKIFIDSEDNLWVASLSRVSVFRKSDQTFHVVNLEGVPPNSFYTFGFFESRGNVIIHCSAGVFLAYKQKNGTDGFRTKKLQLYNQKELAYDYVHLMNPFGNRLALISFADQYSPARILLAELTVNEKDTLIQIQNRLVTDLSINVVIPDKDLKNLYLGTSDGIHVLTLEPVFIKDEAFAKGQNIQNLLIASDHKLYFNSADPALRYIDLMTYQSGQYLPDPLKVGSLLDNDITCLFEDFSGNLWVGHRGLGLSILNLNKKAFHSFKRDPSNSKSLGENIVMCFNGTKNEIIVGLRQGGINITSKQFNKGTTSTFQKISYRQQSKPVSDFDNIWDIARESDSVFWVASTGGLDKLIKTSRGWTYGSPKEPPLHEGTVRKVLIDKNHNIWCGTSGEGLIFFPDLRKNPERKSYRFTNEPTDPDGISDKTVLSMLIDSKNRFWVGTNNGLNLLKTPYDKLDLSGTSRPIVRFQQFVASNPENDFLNANEINCIFENNDGKLWLATQGGGINIMNTDSNTFSHLTVENGLPGNDVQGILSDQSGIKWVSTNKGIVSIDVNNKEKPFTYYSQSDGIQGETFKVNSWFKSYDGEMFFGGDNGFTRFYPNEITLNPIPPKIGLTYFRIMNQIVKIGDTISRGNIMLKSLNETNNIVLPFNKNSFSIGVGVHHYQYPDGNRIRYKLEGYSDRWITIPSANNPYIYFSKIPEGKYTLRISGMSTDNIEATHEKVLHIHILPPWYKTWYMTIFFLLLIITIVGVAIHTVVKRQRVSFEKKIDAVSFESNENKMKFLTNIAHELRTPLSLVVAPIEDMMKNYTTIDPKWKNHINLIYRNSNYLLTLINQIIDFRKLNAGKLQLNLQVVDLGLLIKDVTANFKGLESRRKTNLEVQVPDKSIMISIDSQKIEEVLYNLLSNAFKHTSENRSIKVSLEVVPTNSVETVPDKKQVRITVFNEGRDISDEDKMKIFERFYKVSEKVDGAGIGLSFSKSLIEMHHGTISVESVNGIGVAFHVVLPFDKIEASELDTEHEKNDFLWQDEIYENEQAIELDKNGHELSIVIVEDNIDLRTFLKKTLSNNYHCYEASDGKEGYELISKIIPDIVISDVVMPKMDGYELCKKIKENGKTCHIPIVLLTANNASEHVVSGYERGADAYITKPFDLSIIKAQISRLIKNRELIRERYMTHNFMVEISNSNISRDDEFIIKLRQLLEDNLSESDFNVKKLSSDLNISTTHLYRKLKALTGLSPVEFIRIFKLQKACEILSNSNLSIKEIGYSLGFNNLSYFVKCFREQFNVTPSAFRQKGMQNTTTNNSTNQSGVA